MEQAVTVHLQLDSLLFGSPRERESIQILEERLERAIAAAEAGEFDGDEFVDRECVLHAYGPDADRLFATIEPVLRTAPLMSGGYAIKRYGAPGDAGALEVRVTL